MGGCRGQRESAHNQEDSPLVFKMAQTGRSFSAEKWRTPKRAVAQLLQIWLTGLFQRMRHMAHTPKVYKSEMADVSH